MTSHNYLFRSTTGQIYCLRCLLPFVLKERHRCEADSVRENRRAGTDQKHHGRADSEGGEGRAGHEDLDGARAQDGVVQERGLLRGLGVLVLGLGTLLHAFQVQDGASLRMVQRRGPVEDAQHEHGEHDARQRL